MKKNDQISREFIIKSLKNYVRSNIGWNLVVVVNNYIN